MNTVIKPFDPTEALVRVENNRACQDAQEGLYEDFRPRWKTVIAAVRSVRAAIDLQRLQPAVADVELADSLLELTRACSPNEFVRGLELILAQDRPDNNHSCRLAVLLFRQPSENQHEELLNLLQIIRKLPLEPDGCNRDAACRRHVWQQVPDLLRILVPDLGDIGGTAPNWLHVPGLAGPTATDDTELVPPSSAQEDVAVTEVVKAAWSLAQPPSTSAASDRLPACLLLCWDEITKAVGLKNTELNRERIRRLNQATDCKGPIRLPSKGGQPQVDRQKLLDWWDQMANLQEQAAQRAINREETVKEQYEYAKNGTVVPALAGHVRKRRAAAKKGPAPAFDKPR